MAVRLLSPTILQRHHPIKHRLTRRRIHPIRNEVPMPFELESIIRQRFCHPMFKVGSNHFLRIRIQTFLEILPARIRIRIGEEAVV